MEKKTKTFKIRLFKDACEEKPKKPRKKIVRIAKKVDVEKIIDESLEKDFLLENGNPIEFFRKHHSENCSNLKNERHTGRSSLGSKQTENNSRMDSSLSLFGIKRGTKRKVTSQSNLFKIVNKEIMFESNISHIKKRIEDDRKKIDEKLKNLSNREKLVYFKDEKSLGKFENFQKTWSKIEDGLTKRSKKSLEELISKKNMGVKGSDERRKADWLMTLRRYGKNDKFEKFIPVGNKLSGLFLRDVIKPENIGDRSKSCNDLKLVGIQVLPLEIEAVKRVGNRSIPVSRKEEKNSDEILVENYDYTHRFFKDF